MRRIAVLLLGLAAVLASTATTAGAADPEFTLTVDYRGLYPNAQLDVPVTVRNPQTFPIVVHTATTTVGDAGIDCTSSNIDVSTFTGDVRVPARGSAIVPIHFHMLASAPDTCQNATFPLSFHASGAPASDTSPDSGTGGFAFTGNGAGTLALAAGGAAALVLGGGLLAARRRRIR
jgi:LPXTG-motif cell wall-anchored protein